MEHEAVASSFDEQMSEYGCRHRRRRLRSRHGILQFPGDQTTASQKATMVE